MSIKLREIIKNDFKDLYKITSNINIMKFVGNGYTWNENKTKSFIKYSLKEQKLDLKKRNIFFYSIVNEDKFIGIIGIHKYINEDNYYLTFFINKKYHGKGYGTKALKLILDKVINLKKNINFIKSQILFNNIGSEKVCKKVGFYFDKNIKRNNKDYKEYIYNPEYHNILKLDYPYLSNFITESDVKKYIKLLKNYKPDIINGSINKFTKNMEIKLDYVKDKNLNNITDYFTDKCRVKCVFKNNKYSPLQYYKKNKGDIIKKSFVKNNFDLDKFEKIMYYQKNSKFCNNFPLTIAITIYKLFKAKNIFDSSAGWGDRLVASIAYGANYTGVDPSECLKPLYEEIINKLGNKKKTYEIINKGIENAKIKKNYYDLCFTSPPFFDLEVYEDNENQSIKKYTNKEKWEKEFFTELAEKNINALKKNGHFVLYVTGCDYCLKYLKNHKKLKYLGILSFITPKKRSINVYKKI